MTIQYTAHPADPASSAVLTRGLVKRYGDFLAVNGLNLNVPAHGVYGLLGPNGAGKSTTMKLLLGLASATSGDMWMLGEKVGGRHRLQAGRVGSMIEGPSFYPGLSGLDNCRMVADYLNLPGSAAPAILRQVGLAGHEGKKARDYSLGMKQRLGIAMALISQPELLLLDEPTNGLDAEAVVEVREMIMGLSREQGITVIISSHILSEIEKMAPVVGVIAPAACCIRVRSTVCARRGTSICVSPTRSSRRRCWARTGSTTGGCRAGMAACCAYRNCRTSGSAP